MFDRSRGDYVPEPNAVPFEAVLADGATIRGRVLIPAGKSLVDVLNSTGGFVEFETYDGARTFLAKAQIATVTPVGVPKAPNLGARLVDAGGFDPHAILGLTKGAGRDEIRQAYFRLAKAYHPDRYATAELPQEVRDYLAAMARRVNAAHAALEAPLKQQAAREDPVFTSPGR